MRNLAILLLITIVTIASGSPIDDFAKKLKDASSQAEFDALVSTIDLQQMLANDEFQASLNKWMNPNYVKVLVSTDLYPLIDKKKMYGLVKAGDGTSTAMFGALFGSIDAMKAMQAIDWQSMLVNGGLKDGIVYVPGNFLICYLKT